MLRLPPHIMYRTLVFMAGLHHVESYRKKDRRAILCSCERACQCAVGVIIVSRVEGELTIRLAQFMPASPGLGTDGKNRKKNPRAKKHRAMMLIGIPKRPRLNLVAGNFSPRTRLATTEEMQTMYDVNRPVVERERMMLNAAVEPMMIRARMLANVKVTQTAFVGTPDPGRTLDRKAWKGSPLSRAKLKWGKVISCLCRRRNEF